MTGILGIFKNRNLNYSEKLCFLIDQTYKHFLRNHKVRIGDSVDFHYSLYAKQSTMDAILPAIKEGSIDKCFSNCVNQMKREGKLLELEQYGIL